MDQYRLRSRVRPIPNGLRFAQPELKWDSVKALGKFPSWEQMVQAIIAVRAANPAQLEKHGWSLDPATVADELDQYNTRICLSTRGWEGFVTGPGGTSPPKLSPPGSLVSNVRDAVGASKVLVEWVESGAQAVPNYKANARAKVCHSCPLNGQGGLLKYFTAMVSEAIRAAVSKRAEWNLETQYDDHLGVCQACSCPLKLLVHLPLEVKLKSMTEQTKAKLHPSCWVLAEEKSRVPSPESRVG